MKEIYLIRQIQYLILKLLDNKKCELTIQEIKVGLKNNLDLIPNNISKEELIKLSLLYLQDETALKNTSNGKIWRVGINTQAALAIKVEILAEMFNLSIYKGYNNKNYTHDIKVKDIYKKADNDAPSLDCILLEEDFEDIVWKLKMYNMDFLYT